MSKPTELRHLNSSVTRRDLLRGIGASAVLVGVGPVIEACGGGGTTKTTGSSATVGAQLQHILGTPTGKAAGQGLTIQFGVSMAFTGFQSELGHAQFAGVTLATQHIAAAGGPVLNPITRDDGNGQDVQKGVANAREFGALNLPFEISTGPATGGSEIPFFEQYKRLDLDGSGGVYAYAGRPFFYMTRTFLDRAAPGYVAYIKLKHPKLTRWAMVSANYGKSIQPLIDSMKTAVTNAGHTWLGATLHDPTTTDFSTVFNDVRSKNPDVLVQTEVSTTAGLFIKQYASSGLKARMFGQNFQPEVVRVAGPQLNDTLFMFDYFDGYSPANDWAKLFASEFRHQYGYAPSYREAHYYEATFMIWDLIRRVIAAGGDPSGPGDQWVDAFNSKPEFTSVYGGRGQAYGTVVFDPASHGIKERQLSVITVTGTNPPKVLATCNADGSNLTLVS